MIGTTLLALCSASDPDALAIARDLIEEHGLCLPSMASRGDNAHLLSPHDQDNFGSDEQHANEEGDGYDESTPDGDGFGCGAGDEAPATAVSFLLAGDGAGGGEHADYVGEPDNGDGYGDDELLHYIVDGSDGDGISRSLLDHFFQQFEDEWPTWP